MRVFLDTNILIDYLAKREPFCDDATTIFEMVERGSVEGAMSSLSIINCAYVLRKVFPQKAISETIKWICDEFCITAVDKNAILCANRTNAHDFEDAVQYFSSQYFKPDVILTRDKKGFADLGVLVMTPAEFIAASK